MAENECDRYDEKSETHKLDCIHHCVAYIAFSVAIFVIWQLLGGICVEYNYAGYALGHSELYLLWTWVALIVWVVGSIVFLVKSPGKSIKDF